MKLRGLYAITDSRLTPTPSILEMVDKAISGGAAIVQLRDKNKPDKELLEMATRLCRLCKDRGVIFIVNDRIELAKLTDAHGIHIGKDDIDPSSARAMLPGKIIGVSCYNSLETAIEAEKAGADYVAFGSFFPSPTKPNAVEVPLRLLTQARTSLRIPICAIGGIDPNNAIQTIYAGADMVAVISSLWEAPDVKAQAQRFAKLFHMR